MKMKYFSRRIGRDLTKFEVLVTLAQKTRPAEIFQVAWSRRVIRIAGGQEIPAKEGSNDTTSYSSFYVRICFRRSS